MTKIMLVEDDNNLREIYGARLQAEGYDIVSAKDGEEALAMIVQEKPDVIVADIMMPKISGFDMLDIIRSTPETKDTKVIMMTALSQKEDQERGKQLGADRYLVKSQVTLEDVVRVVGEVLSDSSPAAQQTPAPTQTSETPTAATPAASSSSTQDSNPPKDDPPSSNPSDPPADPPKPEPPAPSPPANSPPPGDPPAPPDATKQPTQTAPAQPSAGPAQSGGETAPSPPRKAPQQAKPTQTAQAPKQPDEPKPPARRVERAPAPNPLRRAPTASGTHMDVKKPVPASTAPPQPDLPKPAAKSTEPKPGSSETKAKAEENTTKTEQSQPDKPSVPAGVPPPATTNGGKSDVHKPKIIQPLSDPTEKPDINELLEKELAQEAGQSLTPSASQQQDSEAASIAPTSGPQPTQFSQQQNDKTPAADDAVANAPTRAEEASEVNKQIENVLDNPTITFDSSKSKQAETKSQEQEQPSQTPETSATGQGSAPQPTTLPQAPPPGTKLNPNDIAL